MYVKRTGQSEEKATVREMSKLIDLRVPPRFFKKGKRNALEFTVPHSLYPASAVPWTIRVYSECAEAHTPKVSRGLAKDGVRREMSISDGTEKDHGSLARKNADGIDWQRWHLEGLGDFGNGACREEACLLKGLCEEIGVAE